MLAHIRMHGRLPLFLFLTIELMSLCRDPWSIY